MVVIIYCYILGCEDEVTTENREDHDVDIFNIIQKVQDTVKKSSGRSHKEVRGKRKELGSSLNTCQGYDTHMLLIHRLSYGPALTRKTEEKASVCQSD